MFFFSIVLCVSFRRFCQLVVLILLGFINRSQDTDAADQTTAGGLGDVEKKPLDFQGVSLTERWDTNIGKITEKVGLTLLFVLFGLFSRGC